MTTRHSARDNQQDLREHTTARGTTGRRLRRPVALRHTDILLVILGTALMALSTNLFYEPTGMVPGGFTGLAMVLQRVTARIFSGGIPVWLGHLLLNIPLALFSLRIRGWAFVKRSFWAALLYSGWLFLIPEIAVSSDDYFLTAILGGVVMGLGMGLLFFAKTTSGGSDTLASLIQHAFPHLTAAKILPVVDATIILLSVWLYGLRVSLYALLSVILIGWIADGLIGIFRNAYLAYIVSNDYEAISERIMEVMDRGATLLSGKGMYTGNDRPVLFCAVSRKQAVLLKDLVYEIDPQAFVVLTDANEVRGEGFLHYSREEF